jgi:hypothetical protein
MTVSPSTRVGTSPRGFRARNSGVLRNPLRRPVVRWPNQWHGESTHESKCTLRLTNSMPFSSSTAQTRHAGGLRDTAQHVQIQPSGTYLPLPQNTVGRASEGGEAVSAAGRAVDDRAASGAGVSAIPVTDLTIAIQIRDRRASVRASCRGGSPR